MTICLPPRTSPAVLPTDMLVFIKVGRDPVFFPFLRFLILFRCSQENALARVPSASFFSTAYFFLACFFPPLHFDRPAVNSPFPRAILWLRNLGLSVLVFFSAGLHDAAFVPYLESPSLYVAGIREFTKRYTIQSFTPSLLKRGVPCRIPYMFTSTRVCSSFFFFFTRIAAMKNFHNSLMQLSGYA